MITIIAVLIEAIWKREYNDLYVGTVLIDLMLIISATAIICR